MAALWPLSAYSVDPILLPALLAFAACAVVVLARPVYGIALVLALSPLTNLDLSAGEAAVKPFQLALPALTIGTLLYALLVSGSEEERPRPPALGLAVVAFVVVATASSIQALEPTASLKKMGIVLTAAALYFTVLQVCKTRESVFVVAGGALAGLLIAGGQGIFQQVFGSFSEHGFVVDGTIVQRVQGSFGHPNQYGGYLALLIPLAVAVVAGRFPSGLRVLAGLALAAALPALTFSYVRGAIAALVLGSLVWLTVLRPRAAVGLGLAVALAAATLAPATLKERFRSDSTGQGGDISLREDLWGGAIDIYSERPILGVGLNNFAQGYGQLPAVPRSATQRRLLHHTEVLVPPHAANLYLNVLAEEGILGVLSLLALGAGALGVAYRGARVRDAAGRALSLAVGAAVLVLAFHSMLEVTLLTEAALPLFALLGAVAAAVLQDQEATEAA